jgi:hypothetical protein
MTIVGFYYGVDPYGAGEYNDGASQAVETSIVNRALTPLPPPVFTGMKLQADVIFNDLVLNTIDENNVIWVCTEIDGWWTLPEPEMPDLTRGWSDGSYDARGRWTARQITLNGSFFPPAPEYVSAARNTLIEAASLVYDGGWLKTNESPTRASWVRLSGAPNIQTVSARGRTDFSIGLKAADPVKYSWNDEDAEGYDSVLLRCKNVGAGRSGEVVITNDGNIDVAVFMEVAGIVAGDATILNVTNDSLFTLIGPSVMPNGTDLMEIDTYAREIAYNGDSFGARAMVDVLVDWITLSPGANTIRFIDEGNASSNATLTVYYRSGWIG